MIPPLSFFLKTFPTHFPKNFTNSKFLGRTNPLLNFFICSLKPPKPRAPGIRDFHLGTFHSSFYSIYFFVPFTCPEAGNTFRKETSRRLLFTCNRFQPPHFSVRAPRVRTFRRKRLQWNERISLDYLDTITDSYRVTAN